MCTCIWLYGKWEFNSLVIIAASQVAEQYIMSQIALCIMQAFVG